MTDWSGTKVEVLLSDDKQRLYDEMSDLSEDFWAAGWIDGNEFMLWGMLTDPRCCGLYGADEVEVGRQDELRRLAEKAGGWIMWSDDSPRFVPMAEWLTIYEAKS